MRLGRFEETLRNPRWRPYLLGCLLGLPVTLVMLQVWRSYDYLAWGWLFLYSGLGGFGLWWRTPGRKTVSTALLVGTFVPFLIR